MNTNYKEIFESFTQKVVNNTKNTTQEKKRQDILSIQFEDPEVERICHEHGVYTVSDARKVTSIKEWFYNIDKIKSFNEFKYFNRLKDIERHVFTGCTSLQSINIPNNVASIGDCAFACCESLQSINIPDSVTHIGDHAFYECKSLQSINIPDSVTSIDESAFIRCESLQTINIPKGITIVERGSFQGCTSLQSITIPDSVMIIGRNAFLYCKSLKSINIPNSVKSIGTWAFNKCTSLQSIYISKDSPVYGKIKEEYPNIQLVDPSEMNESFTKDIIKKEKSTTQEDKRQLIMQIQFEDPEVELICHEHGVYIIGDAREVTSIKDWFFNNDKIKTFDEFKYFTGLKDIEEKAFYKCSSLQSINIPYSVTSIEKEAFEYCKSLQSINIPNSVTSIGDYVFDYCKSLQSINIPNSVTSIGKWVFANCTSLQSINIPNSVTSIEVGVFWWCKFLQSIIISKNCPVYDKIANDYPKKQLVDPSLQESFTAGVINKTKSKTQEEKRNDIVQIQFKDPEVERICHEHGVYTVSDARKVTSIRGWFSNYRNIVSFNEFKYFTGLKDVEDRAFSICSSLRSIDIPDSVTSIEEMAFSHCESLQSINIPNSVTNIGISAFCGCSSLQSINIPNSVTNIGDRAFIACDNLKSINIPDNVTYIRDMTFNNCENLKSINIPDSVTYIGDMAFRKCNSLRSINIPNSITCIGDYAFGKCKSLRSINIPNSVMNIGDYIVGECTSLQTIYISKNCPVYDKIKEEYHNVQLVDPSEMNESFTKGVIKKAKSITQDDKRKIVSLPDRDLLIDFIVNGYKPLYATSDQILPYIWDVIKRCNENIEILQKIHFNVYKTQLEFTYLNEIGTHVPIVSVNMNSHFPASVVHNFAYAKKEVRDKRKYKNLYELTCTYADMIIELCKKYSEISDHIKSLLDSHFSGSSVTESFTSKVMKDTKEKSQLDNKDKVEDLLYGKKYNDFPEFVEDLVNNLNEKGYLVKNNKLDANNYRRSTYMTERQKGDYFPVLKWSVRYHYRRHNVNICKIYYPLSLIDDFYRQRSIIFLRISLLSNPNDFDSLCNSTIDLFTMKDDMMISLIYSNEIYNKEFLDIIGFDKKTENYNGVKLNGILLYHIEKFLIRIINKLDTVYQDNTTYRSYILSLIDSEKGYPETKDIYLRCTNVINKLLEK